MQFTPQTARKIGVVYGIFVILLVIALGIRFLQGNNLKKAQNAAVPAATATPQPTSYPGKVSLERDKIIYKIGEAIDSEIFIEAPGKVVDGTDVILRFDPAILNAQGFTPGTYFSLTPRKDMDNIAGTVKITSLDPVSQSPMSDKISLGTAHFTAMKPGSAQIKFGKTTITEKGTSGNILGEAKGITITVEP